MSPLVSALLAACAPSGGRVFLLSDSADRRVRTIRMGVRAHPSEAHGASIGEKNRKKNDRCSNSFGVVSIERGEKPKTRKGGSGATRRRVAPAH